jgi:hypothetical protein
MKYCCSDTEICDVVVAIGLAMNTRQNNSIVNRILCNRVHTIAMLYRDAKLKCIS